jgi:hypothetical protein
MMTPTKLQALWLIPVLSVAPLLHGCGTTTAPSSSTGTASDNSANPATTSSSSASGSNEADATPLPKELVKPASGKGNVQGKVLFNDKPAVNIEVTLSEKFSPFLGRSGKSYVARTDKNGDYVIKNVPPKEYEGLTARVFDTDSVIFIKSGFVEAKKYNVEAGKTLFVEPTHLFKSDLVITAPKAASTMASKQAAFKWKSYPDAAYYKISIYPDDMKSSSGVFQERVDGTSYQSEKPLPAGSYRLEVHAYNANDHELAESAEQYKFRISS